jgi:hypothetical protein
LNGLTLKIFTDILHSEEAWDKKTRELRYEWVLSQAYIYRYALYEPIQTRLYKRAVHLCHILTSLKEDDYATILQDGREVEYFADDCVTERFVGDPSACRVTYIESIWYGSYQWALDMSMQTLTKEELLALGIHPHLVPAKPNQPSLL